MTNYKITNLTNTAGKRDMKFNTVLNIEYVDEMKKKTINVKPGETVYLQISSLPLSVHRLRVKKLISVVEVSNNELNNSMNTTKPHAVPPIIETPEEQESRIASIGKKRIAKKSHEAETVENQ